MLAIALGCKNGLFKALADVGSHGSQPQRENGGQVFGEDESQIALPGAGAVEAAPAIAMKYASISKESKQHLKSN